MAAHGKPRVAIDPLFRFGSSPTQPVYNPPVTARVDLTARTVLCSVHDLLPEVVQRTVGRGGEGLSRLTVGSELHRMVQNQRQADDSSYRSEVPIDTQLEVDGWTLRVLGRADGVTVDETGTPVVEEIKTLHFRSELFHLFAEQRLERYRWQARLYAALLFPGVQVKVRLVLVDLGGTRHRIQEVETSPNQVQAYIRARLAVLVAAERRREAQLALWQDAARTLPFPHPTMRPGQQDVVLAVEQALGTGRHLLLSAPTGSGKTAAALYPAVKTALAAGAQAVFLTAKTLQQALAVETLRRMQDGRWRSLQIRAKAKMCANREVICHEEFCRHAREYGSKLADRGVLETVLSGPPHLDPDRIFAVSDAAEVCPFEVSLELVSQSAAAVCDYNYVFDPGIAVWGGPGGLDLADVILVIDEAHNLVDRARGYYSPLLSRRALRSAIELLQPFQAAAARDLVEVLESLDDTISRWVSAELGQSNGVVPTALDAETLGAVRISLDALMVPYFNFKRNHDLWLAEDPVLAVVLALARLGDLVSDGGEELVHLVQRLPQDEGGEAVRIQCLDASRFTGAVLARTRGVVAMSATLQPFDFYRDLLGFDPDRTDELVVASPFPAANRLVVAVDSVDTSFRQRGTTYQPVADLIAGMAPAGRNALALFPSYAYLREVAQRLHAPGHSVAVQRENDSDRAREEILRRLRSNGEPVLLLAVLGGVFAEGVDYPGEMLSQVVVVSPALPQVGPERELLKQFFEQRYERGFEYAYLVPGMTRVVQAAGRLIRSEHDRGAIVLICKRFLRQPYLGLLPEEWSGGDGRLLQTPDPVAAVRAFFEPDLNSC